MKPKRILLLSAYDAHSHRYWQQQLQDLLPQHQWTTLALKDRYFAWRMGGNALNFTAQYPNELQAAYDLVLATSMTDLSTLRGLYPGLAKVPNLLYFHENQFAYPSNDKQQGLKEIQLRSIFSALVADRIAFNSTFNRDSFLAGVSAFAKLMPDGIPPDLVSQIENKSTVLPVPLAADCVPDSAGSKQTKNHLEVVWNHRWEHDKGPETLLALLRLCQDKPNFKFHIMGQQFRNTPSAMQQIKQHHAAQCLTLGFVESRAQYIATLQRADVALSTAHHDFQGIALQEAVACGCMPLVPDRLVYPELYPANNRYPSKPHDPATEAQHIYSKLQQLEQLTPSNTSIDRLDLATRYQQWLNP